MYRFGNVHKVMMYRCAEACPRPDNNFLWELLGLRGCLKNESYLCPMAQTLIIIALFSAAIFYVGRMIYKSFTAKTGCASGCGKCGVDFNKIEQQIQRKA